MKAARSTYAEKLRDSRWQEMRLEVMRRDRFLCQRCFDDTHKMLSVHHTYYTKWTDPWDYPPESLTTVCDDCHKTAEVERQKLAKLAGIASAAGIGEELCVFIRSRLAMINNTGDRIPVASHEQAAAVAMAVGEGECINSIWTRAEQQNGTVSPVAITEEHQERYQRAWETTEDAYEATLS